MNRARKNIVVTIDGPAASGKSTTARLVAQRLNWLYLDTGAMYRSIALKVVNQGIELDDDKNIGRTAREADINLRQSDTGIRVFLDGEDVSEKIRTPEIDRAVGPVCEVGEVRRILVEHQRKAAEEGNIIAEGRDMGTVVFPDADLKFFMRASLQARTERRLRDMRERGESLSQQQVQEEIERRDKRDSERANSPLKQADDAIVLDTSQLSIEDQVLFVIDAIRGKGCLD